MSHSGAFATHWKGDNDALRHSPHKASDAVQREELEDTLSEIVDGAMSEMNRSIERYLSYRYSFATHRVCYNMNTSLEHNDSCLITGSTNREKTMAAAEPADAKEILRLKMKYKYKYKYKYKTQAQDADDLLGDTWDIDPAATQTADLSGTSKLSTFGGEEDEDDIEDYWPFSLATEEVSMENVTIVKHDAQEQLNLTWKNLAAPPSAPDSPTSLRQAMQTQRDKYMPISRWLKKLVHRIDELCMVLSEVKEQQSTKQRQERGMGAFAAGKAPNADEEAESATNEAVQKALANLGEQSVTSKNLMHTSKQYDLVRNLRKQLGLGMTPAGTSGNGGNENQQLHQNRWNKSVFCGPSKQTSMSKQTRSWREYRADPYDRMEKAFQNSKNNA
jgi:hypothetical protein